LLDPTPGSPLGFPLFSPPGNALETAAPTSDAVPFTVSTTRLITLRALARGPAFFAEAFFVAGAFFAAAFFAGAFFAAFFAGAFFEAFFAGAFFAAFFEELRLAGAFFDTFLLLFLLDFFAADFLADFFAGFLDFLAAMDSLLFRTVDLGSRTFERKFVLRGNRVAQISM
jgi:hypothetical protein